MSRLTRLYLLAGLLWLAASAPAWACATCYGASDSPLAQGMNWGILTLLGVVGFVLTGIVIFFIYVARRAARLAAAAEAIPPLPQT